MNPSRDRVAMRREVFEASHVLDRHPIPIDPDDDEATAAARIAIDRLGIPVVAPIRAERDAHAAIVAVAEASHAIARRIALSGGWAHADHGPMVVFAKDDGRPIALLPRSGRAGYVAVDPRQPSSIVRVGPDLAASFDAVAFTFAATLPHRGTDFAGLFAFGVRESLHDVGRVAALGFASALLASVVPLAIGPVLGSILPAGLRSMLVTIAGLLALAVAVAAIAEAVRNLSVVRAKARFGARLQHSIVHRLVGHSPAFFRRFTVVDIASRALGVDEIELYVSDAALGAVLTGVFSLVSFLIVLAQDPAVGIVCALLSAVTLAAFAVQTTLELPLRREIRRRTGAISTFVHQTMTGIAKIRAAAAVDRTFVRWIHGFLIVRRLIARMSRIGYRFAMFATVWPTVATLCVIVTVLGVHDGAMEPGTFFTILSAFAQLLAAMILLGSNVAAGRRRRPDLRASQADSRRRAGA